MRVHLASLLLIPYFLTFSLNSEVKMAASDSLFAKTDSIQSDTLVKMERTVCFGTCPSYTLSIQKNGHVTFDGKEFVDHKGLATGKMSQEKLDLLIQRIEESRFFEVASDPECDSRYTDMPSVFLTIDLDGKQHSVSHYQGCKGFQFEEELYDLEETVDSLAGVNKWIERDEN